MIGKRTIGRYNIVDPRTRQGLAVKVKQDRKYYLPYMCDHGYVLEAALRAQGIEVETLPPPDDETMAIGLDICQGRECSPCFTTTGDIIRRARRSDFDPAKSAVLMPTAGGACRFGQYNVFQREVLTERGLGQVEVISPSTENSYQGFGNNPQKLRLQVWSGLTAVDLLHKLVHQYRPYEINPGQTDALYRESLTRICHDIETESGNLVQVMEWMAGQFEALPVDRSEPRPLIGLVGEIYLRFNNYSNLDIIRRIEKAGGEVMLASLIEFLYLINWTFKTYAWGMGRYVDYLVTFFTDKYQQYAEYRLAKPVAHLLEHPYETPVAKLMDNIRPYYEPILGTEAVLSMGKAVELAHHGACGIVNVMPFSCMPGILVSGIAPRMRQDLDNIPWLDISYDAQGGTNINTRLEAFMYQAVQFQRRQVRPH